MVEKFGNRYRVPSSRLHAWDYATHAAYFVTICTAGHEHYFGKILQRGHVDVNQTPGANETPGANVETPCMASLLENNGYSR
jgi:hypothetical protein